MKSRTIIKVLLVFTIVSAALGSCNVDEFLDKPPGVDVTEDTIFSTKRDIETFLYGTYTYGMSSYFPYYSDNSYNNPNPNQSMTACFTDEAEMAGSFFNSQQWNSGSIVRNNITNQEDRRFNVRWTAIRRCNIIIERMKTDAVLHGTDCECSNNGAYNALSLAVAEGLITEDQIDTSLRRLFEIRLRLGMFDPADRVPYAAITTAIPARFGPS